MTYDIFSSSKEGLGGASVASSVGRFCFFYIFNFFYFQRRARRALIGLKAFSPSNLLQLCGQELQNIC